MYSVLVQSGTYKHYSVVSVHMHVMWVMGRSGDENTKSPHFG